MELVRRLYKMNINPKVPSLDRRARVQTDRISGKPVLLYPEGVLLLNPTGAAILELMDGSRSVEKIIQILCSKYDDSQDSISKGTEEYLHRLEAKGLVIFSDEEERL